MSVRKERKRRWKYRPKIIRGKITVPQREEKEKIESERWEDALKGSELYLSLWQYDGHTLWRLWDWKEEEEERIKAAVYRKEQKNRKSEYRENWDKFQRDWEAGRIDPGMVVTFPKSRVKVIEVIQEELDTVNHEKTKRAARNQRARAEEERKKAERKKAKAIKDAAVKETAITAEAIAEV